jgi:hypothetical protein
MKDKRLDRGSNLVDGDPEKINAERQSGILQQPKRQLKRKRVRPMATETQQHINRGTLCLG